ncbi:MAG: hypothetical protein IMZ43_01510 [Thermoplasmata archaeon]|nr:hypothetical protein [Thermoplasmata archaeon]
MSDYIQIPTITPIPYDVANQTGCVPITDVISALHTMVRYGDAIKFGELCFFAGLIIGILVTYFWYRGRIKEWQPEDL